MVQDILWASLHYVYEPVSTRWPAKELRENALQTVMQHIHYEDENTRYICIGPVNKVCISSRAFWFICRSSEQCMKLQVYHVNSFIGVH